MLPTGNNPLAPLVSEIFDLKYADIIIYLAIYIKIPYMSTDNKKCLKHTYQYRQIDRQTDRENAGY